MATTNYVVDANIYIGAFQNYYRFQFGTRFWDLMRDWGERGRVVSIDRVKDELTVKPDELSRWVKILPGDAFVCTDRPDVIHHYGKLNQWAQGQPQYTIAAKQGFASAADVWIIAYALSGGHTIVTHERYNHDARSRIMIPNVCKPFSVRYINTFDMLDEIGAKLG